MQSGSFRISSWSRLLAHLRLPVDTAEKAGLNSTTCTDKSLVQLDIHGHIAKLLYENCVVKGLRLHA